MWFNETPIYETTCPTKWSIEIIKYKKWVTILYMIAKTTDMGLVCRHRATHYLIKCQVHEHTSTLNSNDSGNIF